MSYAWITQHRNGAEIADVGVALKQRKYTLQLNRPMIATASILATDPHAIRSDIGGLQPGAHEMKIRRGGTAQETVLQLAKLDVSGDENNIGLSFEWHGIASYFQDALIYPQAAAYSSTTLPWDWIETFQARTGADLGITEGSYTGTPPTRQKTIQQEAELLSTIQQVAESGNGFDFNINTDRQWVEWHTQRGSDNGLVLEYGVNLNNFSYTEDTSAGQITNTIFVVGPPGSQVVTATDATSRTTYGRREAAASFFADFEDSTVTDGQLQAHADKIIAERPTPKIVPSLRINANHESLEWGSYNLGDTVNFRARIADYTTIDAEYRIVQIDVELDDNDNETISLGLNEV